jgi:hypothetical protein
MLKLKLAKPMLAALAACAASVAFNGAVFADDAETQALKDQMRIMQQQMLQLQQRIDALSRQQAAVPAPAPAVGPTVAADQGPAAPKEAPAEPKFEKFMKGFFGTLDVSLDDATKGIRGLTAYSYSYAGAGPGTGYVNNGPKGTQITGSVGWLGDLATN